VAGTFTNYIHPTYLNYNGGTLTNVSASNFNANFTLPSTLRSGAGRGMWLDLKSPLGDANMSQFAEAGNIVYTPTATDSYSAYTYNSAGAGSSVWSPITSAAFTLTGLNAMHLWFRDSFFGANAGRLSFSGTPSVNIQSQVIPYSANTSNWSLIGNPRLKTVDLSDANQFTYTNLASGIAIYRNNIRAYAQWSPSFSINGGTSKVAPGQGFYLTPAANPLTLSLATFLGTEADVADYNTAKATNTELYSILAEHTTTTLRTSSVPSAGTISLQLQGNGGSDETVVRLDNSASASYQTGEDMPKMMGSEMALYSLASNGTALAGNSWNPTTNSNVIDLRFRVDAAGTYTMNITTAPFVGVPVAFVDYATNERVILSQDATFSYTFTVEGADVANVMNRFALELNGVTASASDLSSKVSLYPNPAQHSIILVLPTVADNAKAEVVDMRGVVVKQFSFAAGSQTQTLNITDLTAGFYTLRTTVNGERIVKGFSKK